MREWYRIGYENFEEFLLSGRAGHNCVVIVIGYLDLLIASSQFYVESIGDPLHCFVEFTMRYCMLRNAVLALEVLRSPSRKSSASSSAATRGTAAGGCAGGRAAS